MKKILILVFAAICAVLPADTDSARQALYGAVDQSGKTIKAAPFGRRTVAILPIRGDINGIVAGRLKNLTTNAGFTCVEGSNDPIWNTIIKEIAWNERKSDILDAETVTKFGKMKAVQILLYGSVRCIDQNENRVYAEIELHATDLATKQHIWGGNFAFRLYLAKDVHGIINLDNELKALLKKNFEIAKKSIESPAYAGKLNNVRTITVIPLTGDIDQYLTGLAIEALTQTKHAPKNPQIPSLSHFRSIARDGLVGTDAVFYGMVRDLRAGTPVEKRIGKKKIAEFQVDADIQLYIEDTKTSIVLWSKTITLSEKIRTETPVEPTLTDNLKDNWKNIVIIVGAVFLILLAIFGIKVYCSYNTVR